MKKRTGFSLAEALITLLIVSLIAVLSAPVITKKARNKNDSLMWTFVKADHDYIYPSKNRDLMLGSKNEPKGIIVNGMLVFKNRKGEPIGWISEDGSSSFSTAETQVSSGSISNISPEELDKMVKSVTESMKRQGLSPSVQQSSGPVPPKSEAQGSSVDMNAILQSLQGLQGIQGLQNLQIEK